MDQLTQQLQTAQEAYHQVKSELQHTATQESQLQFDTLKQQQAQQFAQFSSEVSRLNEVVKQQQQQLSALQQAGDAMKLQLQAAQDSRDQLQSTATALKSELEAKLQLLRQAGQSYTALEQQLIQLQHTHQVTEAACADITRERDAIQAEVLVAEGRASSLSDEVHQLQQQLVSVQSELVQASTSYARMNSECEAMREQLESLTIKYELEYNKRQALELLQEQLKGTCGHGIELNNWQRACS